MQYNNLGLCTLEINALMECTLEINALMECAPKFECEMEENNAFIFQGTNMYWMQLRSSQNLVMYES